MDDSFHLFDTTLRDGAQGEGMFFSVADKLAVARLLDELGVGFIEGGWPGALPKDTEFFARARTELELKNAVLVAFGATRKAHVDVTQDPQVQALLDAETPVVCVATESPVLEKVVSNMQEVRARGAHVVAVATEGDVAIGEHAEEVLRVPRTDWMLQPILAVIPLQLLAYRIARLRGLNVDQPRNLAKTVTVE